MPWKPWRFLPLVLAPLATPQTTTLPAHEVLHYDIEWRLITAGKARVEFQSLPAPRSGWQANLHIESVGLVSKLFKVEDDYVSNLSPALCAQTSQITSHEGSRQRETKITFDAAEHKASYLERDRIKNTVILSKEIEIPPCVHDVVGGLFLLRTLNLDLNQSIQEPVSDGKKSISARIEAQERETVKTPLGSFKTIRYEVHLFNGSLYQRSGRLFVWLTDDARRIPVQIRARLQFTTGTITLQLAKRE